MSHAPSARHPASFLRIGPVRSGTPPDRKRPGTGPVSNVDLRRIHIRHWATGRLHAATHGRAARRLAAFAFATAATVTMTFAAPGAALGATVTSTGREVPAAAAAASSMSQWTVAPGDPPGELFHNAGALRLGIHVAAPTGIKAFGAQALDHLDVRTATATAPPPPPPPVQAAIDQGVPAAEAESYAAAAYGYDAAVGDTYYSEYASGGAEAAYAATSGAWDFGVDYSTADPWAAQAAVDSYGISHIDYGGGFDLYAGHNYGVAGGFLNVNAGDTINLGGQSYTAGDAVTVPPGTTSEGFQGTWIQTCDEFGNLVLRQIY